MLLGLRKPLTVVPPSCGVDAIVQMTAMTALQALRMAGQPADIHVLAAAKG